MKINDVLRQAEQEANLRLTAAEVKAKKLLLKGTYSLLKLADAIGESPSNTQKIVDKLQNEGVNIHLIQGEITIPQQFKKEERLVVNSKDYTLGEWITFGVCGDNHLCNKHARLDVLNTVYDWYEREGITTVFNTGNMLDGECRFNKHELVVRSGFEPQMEYFANEYPQRKGIKTKFITGEDHEGWWTAREGINVGKRMEQEAKEKGRNDLVWIGHVERDIEFKAKKGSAWGRVMHPGGGSAYATSYSEQKIVESWQGGEKPNFCLIGHYHKYGTGFPREVWTVQTACTSDQTAFLRRQKIRVDVGALKISIHQAETGEINRFVVEFGPFFDRGFYAQNDKYKKW